MDTPWHTVDRHIRHSLGAPHGMLGTHAVNCEQSRANDTVVSLMSASRRRYAAAWHGRERGECVSACRWRGSTRIEMVA